MPSYVTEEQFRLRTLVPAYVLDEIETQTPGWLNAQLEALYAEINARMGKRYNVPFPSPPPSVVQSWTIHIVSLNAWLKRGVSAIDETFAEYQKKHDRAYDEMKEAADSTAGLFELPLSAADDASGVKRGTPLVYSEQSPYVGFTRQARTGREEDRRGDGTKR